MSDPDFFTLYYDDECYPATADDIDAARMAARQLVEDGHGKVAVYVPGCGPDTGYPLFTALRDKWGNVTIRTSDRERAYDPKRRK